MGQLGSLHTIKDLEIILDIPSSLLWSLARNIEKNVKIEYIGEKKREICKPSKQLKRVQKLINKRILQLIPLPSILHGSVPKKSPKTNAEEHVGKPFVFALDIKDFYPNVHHTRIYELYIEIGCSSGVANLLTRLATYNGHLAQGFPTSSTLANILLAKIAPRLVGICKEHGLKITLYQDDLTISGGYRSQKLYNLLEKIFRQEGFILHRDIAKKKLMPKTRQQKVTGYIVNQKVNISSSEYRRIRAVVYLCKVKGIDVMAGDKPVEQFKQHIEGRIERVIEVNPERGIPLLAEFISL